MGAGHQAPARGGRAGEEPAGLAADAYVYGYPLVAGLSMVEVSIDHGFGPLAPTPFNHFAHAEGLAAPDAHFVSVDLVENPAGRYSIGDRTPGLVYADDGSLTLRLRRERPADPGEAANWLPTPEGDFRPMMRLYAPDQPVLDGSYAIPAIERVRSGIERL